MYRTQPNLSLKDAKERFEKAYIKSVLQDNECNLRKTAEALDMHYSNLLLRLKRLGVIIKHHVEVQDDE